MSRRLFELILAIKRKCQCNEEQIQAELGLSPAQFHGLMVLGDDEEVLGCEFAGRMGLSRSRGSRVLNTLVTHGYVKTQAQPEDRRAIRVSLTGRGRRMKARITDRMTTCEKRIIDNLDHRGRAQVAQALELLEAVL
ncbi:MAG: MarR family transcriptional regulator [Phycisphaerales bacterium]|nr:MAG: MarR family transcriptional regulator [Phycisphaerales bacterium]